MCLKYEDKYKYCFDTMIAWGPDEGTISQILDEHEIEITDHEKLRLELLKLFDQMHEEGVIRPKQEPLL